MRIKGKSVIPPKPVKAIIYRESDDGKPDNIEFLCGAVIDYSEFNRLYPQPKPPHVLDVKNNTEYHDTKDKKYIKKIEQWSDMKIAWMTIMSLNATPGLEWETVKLDDPETWMNYEKELKQVLTEAEFHRIINSVVDANSPNANRRREALDVFTDTAPEEPAASQSQKEEATISASGGPANG
jgi:hypothetical protein